jgi:hypothetical protein
MSLTASGVFVFAASEHFYTGRSPTLLLTASVLLNKSPNAHNNEGCHITPRFGCKKQR